MIFFFLTFLFHLVLVKVNILLKLYGKQYCHHLLEKHPTEYYQTWHIWIKKWRKITTTKNQIQSWLFIYKPRDNRQQSKGKNTQNYEPNEFDRMWVKKFLSETVAMYPQYWLRVVRVQLWDDLITWKGRPCIFAILNFEENMTGIEETN